MENILLRVPEKEELDKEVRENTPMTFDQLISHLLIHKSRIHLLDSQMIEINKRLNALEQRDRYSQFQKLNKEIEND